MSNFPVGEPPPSVVDFAAGKRPSQIQRCDMGIAIMLGEQLVNDSQRESSSSDGVDLGLGFALRAMGQRVSATTLSAIGAALNCSSPLRVSASECSVMYFE